MITDMLILCIVKKDLIWSILRKVKGEDAYYTTVDKKTEEAQNIQAEVYASSGLPSKKRSVYQGLHNDAKKT